MRITFDFSNVGVFPLYSQEISEGEHDVTFQLRVTLFDRNHQHFFGKTWKSPPQRMKNNKISFNEVAYKTEIRLDNFQ